MTTGYLSEHDDWLGATAPTADAPPYYTQTRLLADDLLARAKAQNAALAAWWQAYLEAKQTTVVGKVAA
jgi:hypothetical protein